MVHSVLTKFTELNQDCILREIPVIESEREWKTDRQDINTYTKTPIKLCRLSAKNGTIVHYTQSTEPRKGTGERLYWPLHWTNTENPRNTGKAGEKGYCSSVFPIIPILCHRARKKKNKERIAVCRACQKQHADFSRIRNNFFLMNYLEMKPGTCY